MNRGGKTESGKRKAETPSPGLAATLSHRMGEGLGVRALLRAGSRPQFACMSRWKLPMNQPVLGKKIRALRRGSGVPRYPPTPYGLRQASLGSYLAKAHGSSPQLAIAIIAIGNRKSAIDNFPNGS